ncbi:FAD-dependent oxidoreductase [Psychroserpens sp.]|uniref:NAD(P)/FAD-dependent oxidoreductase n=1 Tax=Psychroserpens sp. TaxID=2020870 RepID=UPI001B1A957A|nr:FAD-dependent oxidoreductase [Psychroserpens sp.]MBO6605998.1 FAD-binding oxidoreductase [Psychroserpens sp.]MBO6631017.1 FAD-binding oxidoreductase [Psychroserpens sp.]MBO6652631.1 FAD-binding oxidoreductase [Psychroserpens sp.]MBO6681597.1 FAD-binding oxidoreductase [Psychroserpens sp.]MBO6749372.1 FAD-binding oxidoreductase [Psychroserpens sp.]
MKTVDYIIVGCGLAGIAFCEQLRAANKSFLVFDDRSQHSSRVAAGLYNPVILKRFTKVWNAKSQLELAMPKYKALEDLLNVKLNIEYPVLRKFASIEEQNEWFVAADKPVLSEFMSTKLIKNTNKHINAPHGFGKVKHSGRIRTTQLSAAYKEYLISQGAFVDESFDYECLSAESNQIVYKNFEARHIVFAEGYGISNNPYFDYLPLNGTKGEMLTINAPDLNLKEILKSSVFIVPLDDDNYWIGATYEREDKTHQITSEAKVSLVTKVRQFINCEFTVIDQVAGIRPTTKDRRPLVGRHPIHKNIYVLNGLGTRGVMISPYVAQQLFRHIENNDPLDSEIDIRRFKP